MDFKVELVRYEHTVGESGLHLQFTPAYRRPIFVNERVKRLVELYLLVKADKLGIAIDDLGFGIDHLHVFVCNWKNYSIEDLTNDLRVLCRG